MATTCIAQQTLKALHDKGQLMPFIHGETVICDKAGTPIDAPSFNCRPDLFTFKPAPPAPKLRPWTAREAIEYRGHVFRQKKDYAAYIVEGFDTQLTDSMVLLIAGDWIANEELMRDWEHSADGTLWEACGITE